MCARNRGFINRFASQQGITLMEVLISQALSLCILALAFGIGLAIERQNELLLVLSDLHAHSQIALQALEMEIQAAGFIGCPRLTADFPWAGAGVFPLTAANKLVVMPNALGGSVLTVWHRSRDAAFLEAPMTQPSVLEISTAMQPKPEALLIVSDCRHAELFHVAAVTTVGGRQRLRTREPLQYRYAENAEVGALEITSYAIEKTNYRDEAGRVLWGLYRTDLRGHKSLVVEGIENLRAEIAAGGRGVAIEVQAAQKGLHKKEYAFATLRN